jgi:hypothetical protein
LLRKLGNSSSRSGTYQVGLYLLLTYGLLFFLRSPANNSPQPSVTTSEKVCTRTGGSDYYNGTTSVTLPDGRTITPGTNTFLKWNPDQFTQPTVTFANGKSSIDQYTYGATPQTIGDYRTPGLNNTNISVIRKIRGRGVGKSRPPR